MTEKEYMQKLKNKSNVSNAVSQELEEAVKLEQESCLVAKQARLRLEKALETQDQTTEELKRQGEIIIGVKKASINILENSQKSNETQFKIKQESSILPSLDPYINKIKRWWNRNTKMTKTVDEIKSGIEKIEQNKETLEIENFQPPKDKNQNYEPTQTELVHGENDTNKELHQIFNSLTKMNRNAKNQIEILKEQKGDLKDVSALGEFSSLIIEDTEKQMNKK